MRGLAANMIFMSKYLTHPSITHLTLAVKYVFIALLNQPLRGKSGSMKNRNSPYIGNKLIDAFHKDNSTFKTQPSDKKTGYTFLCLILNQVRQ